VLTGTIIYGADGSALVANLTGGNVSALNARPSLTSGQARNIQLFDHSATFASTPADQLTFGSDYIAGGPGNDYLFGELGNDTIQGDAAVPLNPGSATGNFSLTGSPSLAPGAINATAQTITWSNHGLRTGSTVLLTSGTVSGLTSGLSYTVLVVDPNTIQLVLPVGASRNAAGALTIQPSVEGATDGDDYIEGGGGNDVIFGDLGQDDIIGGSSDLFGLSTPAQRPDGSDMIFGGAGTKISRNDPGDTSAQGHARDADAIVGDDGDIFRLIGISGVATSQYLTFNYDNYSTLRIIPRAVRFLDYTPGGPDYTTAVESAPADVAINPATGVRDNGAADEIHGEGGDDVIYGMVGADVIYGDGQDDNIVGGYGADWISGGTGDDGILGDDGRIFVSRNSTSFGEPLYGVSAIASTAINQVIQSSSGSQFAIINVAGQLKYTVDLTPYSVDPTNAAPSTNMPRPLYANDLIYGGLGNDSIHGGAGEDAISGAEAPILSYVANYDQNGNKLSAVAIESDFSHPVNPGNILGYNPTTTKFALYDISQADVGRREIFLNPDGSISLSSTTGLEWALDFDATEGPVDTYWIQGQTTYKGVPTDGDDHIFGDTGSDWLVGGTGRDSLWGGWGNDLLNADDVLTTDNGKNDLTDTNPSYEDFAFGGAGLDVTILNTNGDRGIDWVGEFNTFLTPYAQFGGNSVQRSFNPTLENFLYALSKSQGADQTLAAQYSSSPARNGEPFGELGLILSSDSAWKDQNGNPRDPQGGNTPGGAVDVQTSAGTKPLYESTAGPVEGLAPASLTDAQLTSIVAAAKQLWATQLGSHDSRLATLQNTQVSVGNLPDDRLGMTLTGSILIDSAAAGRGWFVDPTPLNNTEFASHSAAGQLLASTSSPGPRLVRRSDTFK
jgi:Ca2+-binding RTX toxin-like protein